VTGHISGRTRLAGVIGWPLDHTLSPAMHNAAYAALGLDAVYVPLPVKDEYDLGQVVAAIRTLPFLGFNITMPYKEAILPLCDEVAAMARLAGAVNTVHVLDGRLVGYSTDGRGLLESLSAEAGFTAEGKRVCVLGAGGAASSALVALVLARVARVAVVNRSVERAEELIDRVQAHLRDAEALAVPTDGAEEEVANADLIVNATPLGMRPEDPSPVPAAWLRNGQVVADMVYRPPVTALLRDASHAGAMPVGGLGMLVSQGAMAIDIWLGPDAERAPRDVMRAAAEAELAERAAGEADG
jgi:shikimate dehydrogenase